jgi:hypothetical protein
MGHRRGLLFVTLSTLILFQTAPKTRISPLIAAAELESLARSAVYADTNPPRNPLRNAYYGDLHLHTSYSMDAFAFGTRTTPADSFRYAMGEPVEYFGKQWKRNAPLDFLAVTDHAEYLGVIRETINPQGPFAKSEWYRVMTSSDPAVSAEAFKKLLGSTMVNKPLPEFMNPVLEGSLPLSVLNGLPCRRHKIFIVA